MDIPYKWTCSCCGKAYTGLPLDYGFLFPDYYLDWKGGLSPEEVKQRCFVNEDICVVDETYYFVRGVIELPVLGFANDSFRWGVWVSVSEKSFKEIIDLWDDPAGHGPYFGWLNTEITFYAKPTSSLKTNVHLKNNKHRPSIELQPTDHPLALEQRHGITIERIQEIAVALLHNNSTSQS